MRTRSSVASDFLCDDSDVVELITVRSCLESHLMLASYSSREEIKTASLGIQSHDREMHRLPRVIFSFNEWRGVELTSIRGPCFTESAVWISGAPEKFEGGDEAWARLRYNYVPTISHQVS